MAKNRWVHVVRSGRVLGTGRVVRTGHDGLDIEGVATSWPAYSVRDVSPEEGAVLEARFAKRERIEANKVYRTHA